MACKPISANEDIKIAKVKVKEGTKVYEGSILLIYESVTKDDAVLQKLKSSDLGTVRRVLVEEGDVVPSGNPLIEFEKGCVHPTIIKGLCADCGADLEKKSEMENGELSSFVSMIHMVPELKVNVELAQTLGKADMARLLNDRKLVLLVDLDQTLIHTTNDNIPENLKDVYHFQLYGARSLWYHTRLRPGLSEFLKNINNFYELHICTFGSRRYAHMIASFLDPDGKYFSHRILSRDECFDPNSKTANLRALFPCGENMVCIIDDREDVWDYASNLIHVKPYHFFQHTGDIHAPPGLSKCENDDDKDGIDFSAIDSSDVKSDKSTEMENIDKKTDNDEQIKMEEITEEKSVAEVKRMLNSLKENVTSELSPELKCNGDSQNKIEMMDTDESFTRKETELLTDEKRVPELSGDGSEAVTQSVDEPESIIQPSAEPDSSTQLSYKPESIVSPDEPELSTHQSNETESSTPLFNDVQPTISPFDEPASITPALDEADARIPSLDKLNASLETEKSGLTTGQSVTRSKTLSNPSVVIKYENDKIIIEETDDYLLYLEEILKTIHREFFERFEKTKEIPDLKQVVPETRAKVLKGVKMAFSGIVPNKIKLEESQAYKIARSLGATVTQDIEADTTHLVALRSGTSKVHAAYRRSNLFVVTPLWLWTCAERWEKVDERLYALRNTKGARPALRYPPDHCKSPEHGAGTPYDEIRCFTPPASPPPAGFMYTINPLMTFSTDEMRNMAGEVDDIFDDEEEEGGTEKDEEVRRLLEPDDELSRKRKLDDPNSSTEEEDSELKFEQLSKVRRRKRQKLTPCSSRIMLEENTNEDDDDDDSSSDEDDETIYAKFQRGEALPSDLDVEGSDGTELESDNDWTIMGKALEREFLEDDKWE